MAQINQQNASLSKQSEEISNLLGQITAHEQTLSNEKTVRNVALVVTGLSIAYNILKPTASGGKESYFVIDGDKIIMGLVALGGVVVAGGAEVVIVINELQIDKIKKQLKEKQDEITEMQTNLNVMSSGLE